MDARLMIVGGPSCVAMSWVEELVGEGARVDVVADGSEALRHLNLLQPDAVLIDMHLPGQLDGFDTCRAIRSRSSTLVVFTTSRPAPFDEVVALAVGGDHFFSGDTPIAVVIARLCALLRRSQGEELEVMVSGSAGPGDTMVANGDAAYVGSYRAVDGPGTGLDLLADGDLEMDLIGREVRINGVLTALTRIEFDLLATLARVPRRVFSRESLMESAWDEPFDGSHVLDSHLSRLRRKIDGVGGARVAHAVRGFGYRLRS